MIMQFFRFYSKKLAECAGHFGYIQLELPCFHVGYFKHTLTILQCICKKCSRILLPIADRKKYLKQFQKRSALARSVMTIAMFHITYLYVLFVTFISVILNFLGYLQRYCQNL